MTDYRLTVRVRNARLLRAIERSGFLTVAAFCRAHGINPQIVSRMICMTLPAMYSNGDWRREVFVICDATSSLPDDLFTERQRAGGRRVVAERDLAECDLQSAARTIDPSGTSEDRLLVREAKEAVRDALSKIDPRRRIVVERMQSGDDPKDIARDLNVSKGRVVRVYEESLGRLARALDRKKEELMLAPWGSA